MTINYQKQFKKYVTLEDTVFINGINFEEWRYRYNPFGERESKMRWQKSYYSGSLSPVNAWVYYSLGTSNEQNAVYQGFETSESMIYGSNPAEMYQNYSQAPTLFMYPVEYNVFGNGRNPVMTYKYDPLTAGWRKYYNIYDELGSVVMVINDSGKVVESNQYKAFGVKDYAYKERHHATGYIGKEKDRESNLEDHGVRKYDSDLGRFLCPNDLWEKYISYTPYQYAGNDPINKVDFDGKKIKYSGDDKNEMKSIVKMKKNTDVGNEIIKNLEKTKKVINVRFDDIIDTKINGICTNHFAVPIIEGKQKKESAIFNGSSILIDKDNTTLNSDNLIRVISEELIHAYQGLKTKNYVNKKEADEKLPYKDQLFEIDAKSKSNSIIKEMEDTKEETK